mmetsp:Transcript_14147/g.28822  ORF Transcript_14147/g.28822 Transcript_14147/m.28822 type:complete len:189 (+) Transcript_14147:46-612(+)
MMYVIGCMLYGIILSNPLQDQWKCPSSKESSTQLLKFPTLAYPQRNPRSVSPSTSRHRLTFPHCHHTLLIQHFPKHHMLPIQPIGFFASNKKLAAIGIWPRIRRAQHPRLIVFVSRQILIGEGRCSINTRFARSVVIQKIPPLDHEVFDYTVKSGILVAEGCSGDRIGVFSGAKLSKILACFGAILDK